MKKTKSFIITLFTLMLVCSTLFATPVFAASKKSVKAKSNTSTIYTGKVNNKAQITVTYGAKNVTTKAKYSTSNKKIATVNKKGVVTAKKAGKVTIKAKYKGKTKKIKITVKKGDSKNKNNVNMNTNPLDLNATKLRLQKGNSFQLKLVGIGSDKTHCSWSVKDPTIATVTSNGTVTGVGTQYSNCIDENGNIYRDYATFGFTTVYCKTDNKTYECEVQVNDYYVKTVAVNKEKGYQNIGTKLTNKGEPVHTHEYRNRVMFRGGKGTIYKCPTCGKWFDDVHTHVSETGNKCLDAMNKFLKDKSGFESKEYTYPDVKTDYCIICDVEKYDIKN